jgi:hypothetical protein
MSRALAVVLAASPALAQHRGGGGYRGGYRGGYHGGYRGQPQLLTANWRERGVDSGGEVSRVTYVVSKCRVVTLITANTLAMNLDDVGRHPIVRQRDGVLPLRQAAAPD